LYEQPLKFSEMSKAASKRVREQSNAQRITRAELALILGDSEQAR
jgi:hypothetical protein